MIVKNGILLHYDCLEEGSPLRIDLGRITRIGADLAPAPGEPVIDADGCYVLPGLVDLHTHGIRQVMAQEGGWLDYAQIQMEYGVTTCLPTLFADAATTLDYIKKGLKETDSFRRTPNLLGFRFEFPYVAKPGAGLASALAGPDPDTTESLFQAAQGFVKIWDVSPELEGALPFIRWARERGIVTSLAHSSASIQQTRLAVDAGMRLVTHFYDTFEPAVQTDPGVYPAGLTDYIQIEDRLTAEIIPDGVHVHPLLVEKTLRCKGLNRVAFITDSVKGAGSPPGVYDGLYPGAQVTVTADRGVRNTETDTLSGSALTHLNGFRNAVRKFGRSIREASILCSRTPAQVLGLASKGYLATGMDADIILLDRDLDLKMTLIRGEIGFDAR